MKSTYISVAAATAQTLSREYKHRSHRGGGGGVLRPSRLDGVSPVKRWRVGWGWGRGSKGVWRAPTLSPWSATPASVQASRHAIIRAMDEPDGAGN